MRVVITGGGGFLGQRLAQRLDAAGEAIGVSGAPEPIEEIVLVDAIEPAVVPSLGVATQLAIGDVGDRALLSSVIDRDDVSVFHLASMVSAGCEADFDAALRVNLDGARAVLEACRARASLPRVVFTSSIVAYGGLSVDAIAGDETKLTPETTYGTTKAIVELLVNDYTRKGFIDGRSARLPTVVIRPGRPNAAASGWVSGILREPLNGEACVVPVPSELRIPVSGYRSIVENLLRLHDAASAALGPDRALNLPAIEVTAGEMAETLAKVADRELGAIEFRPDPEMMAFFRGWAQHSSADRALALGLVRDNDLATVIDEYVEDYLTPAL